MDSTSSSSSSVGAGLSGDRSLTLLHLRKTFSSHLKEPRSDALAAYDRMLPLFSRVMSMFTPDELAQQFKELVLFAGQLADLLVQELKRRANVEDTREAAAEVYAFLAPSPPDARGWVMLKSVVFIVNR